MLISRYFTLQKQSIKSLPNTSDIITSFLRISRADERSLGTLVNCSCAYAQLSAGSGNLRFCSIPSSPAAISAAVLKYTLVLELGNLNSIYTPQVEPSF